MYGKALIKSGITFIIASLIFMSINKVYAEIDSYKYDVSLSNLIVSNIKENYTEFNKGANDYKTKLDAVYESFDFYLEDYSTKGIIVSKNIDAVKNTLTSIEDASFNMYKYCLYNINNEETKSMCKTFETNYLGIVNSYKKMLDDYNNILNQYNNYAEYKSLDKVQKMEVKLSNTMQIIYEKIA